MHTLSLILVLGAAGSGKTTFAQHVVPKLGCVYLNTDPIADRKSFNVFAQCFDPADNLVPENERKFRSGQFTINDMPDRLERYYGDDLPYSFQVFLRVRPSRLEMNHGGHEGHSAK